MIENIVEDIFLNQDRNCAETVFMAAAQHFGLSYTPDALKAVGVFGGGIGGTERLCGAAAGAVCAISLKHTGEKAHESPEMRSRSAAFMKEFICAYGSDLCCVIKPLHRKDDVRCLSVVKKAAEILENHI